MNFEMGFGRSACNCQRKRPAQFPCQLPHGVMSAQNDVRNCDTKSNWSVSRNQMNVKNPFSANGNQLLSVHISHTRSLDQWSIRLVVIAAKLFRPCTEVFKIRIRRGSVRNLAENRLLQAVKWSGNKLKSKMSPMHNTEKTYCNRPHVNRPRPITRVPNLVFKP